MYLVVNKNDPWQLIFVYNSFQLIESIFPHEPIEYTIFTTDAYMWLFDRDRVVQGSIGSSYTGVREGAYSHVHINHQNETKWQLITFGMH